MGSKVRSIAAFLALALAMTLSSCGASSGGSSEYKTADSGYYAEEGDYWEEPASAPEPMPAPMEEYKEYGEAEVSGMGGSLNLATASTPSAAESQKLIYSASVSIDTTDFEGSVAALRALMTSCNAFAEYENEWVYSGRELHALQVTLRVPAEHFDELMDGMDGLGGTVTNRSSQVTNITRTYADNEAVIEGLEIQEQRLLEMMKQAETIEDMILVEERLSDVQTQLNRARTSRESMDSDVSLSTVTVSINEVRFETTTGQTSYITRLGNAFADMWENFVEGVGDFFIDIVYAIPAIVIVVALVLLGRKGIKKLLDRKPKGGDVQTAPQGYMPPQAAESTQTAEAPKEPDDEK